MLALFGAAAMAFAQLPPGSDIECIINGISPEAAAALMGEMAQGQDELPEAVSKPLEEAVDACRARGNWSESHAAKAGALAIASLMGAAAEEQLEQAGIAAEAISSWLEAQPASVQTRAELTQADVENLGRALEAAGYAEEKLSANGEAIGLYLGSLIIFHRVGRGLPIE